MSRDHSGRRRLWFVAAAGALFATAALAADSKISALTGGGDCQNGDEFPINRGGSNFKITCGGMANLFDGLGLLATSGVLDFEFGELTDNTAPVFDDTVAIDTGSTIEELSLQELGSFAQFEHRTQRRVEIVDDFLSVTTISTTVKVTDEFAGVSSGTGTNVLVATTDVDQENHPGVLRLETGTTATGNATIRTEPNVLQFGGGNWVFETLVWTDDLSTATEEFDIRAGLGDTSTGDHVDGCYFEYDRNNNTDWNIVCAGNSTRTRSDSNVVVAAAAWIELRITYDGTNVRFYIDDTETAGSPITGANIPTGFAELTGVGVWMVKSAGTTERAMYVDYMGVEHYLTTARE